MRILDQWGAGKTVLAAVFCALAAVQIAACAQLPIQEMSDARQAISAARDTVSNSDASRKVDRAQLLLEQAERELRDGAYAEARKIALQAKLLAIEAREEGDGRPVSQ